MRLITLLILPLALACGDRKTEQGIAGSADDGGLAELASQVTELAASLAATEAALASLQASVDCYIGHQTDDVEWEGHDTEHGDYPGDWQDIEWDYNSYGQVDWEQGPNSDSMKAYEDCF